jgi:hypothetical protein
VPLLIATHRRRFLALLLGATTICRCRAQSAAQALEYRIKAAFVCKFASYVMWPASVFATTDGPITIGVMAADAVVDELTRTAADLFTSDRALAVRRWQRGDSIAGVHILYISSAEDGRLAETLSRLSNQPVLIVTESSPLAPGSMINFVVADDKVRFDIAPQTAEASGLRISVRLLGVARSLVGTP